MSIFLFRNGDNPIEYCATDTRSGHRLPDSSWLFFTELQNAVHAAAFGVTNFEATKRIISRRGYALYTSNRVLKNVS